MSRQGWLRDWEDAREAQEAQTPMDADEERDCEQAVLKLLQLGLALNQAVARHDRRAMVVLVDNAKQQLQVLLCAAGTK